MVFYHFCYYFWGQHCCWTETSILITICLFFYKFPLPSTLLLPPFPTVIPGSLDRSTTLKQSTKRLQRKHDFKKKKKLTKQSESTKWKTKLKRTQIRKLIKSRNWTQNHLISSKIIRSKLIKPFIQRIRLSSHQSILLRDGSTNVILQQSDKRFRLLRLRGCFMK